MTDNVTAQLRRVLAAVAAELDGWRMVTPHDHGASLYHGETGARIYARPETSHAGTVLARLKLTAGVPDGASYSDGDYGRHDQPVPSITVGADRDTAQLARDIGRRITSAAITYHGDVAARMSRRLAAVDAQAKRARELSAVMGGAAREVRGTWRADVPQTASGRLYGELTPDYGGETVRAELRGMTAAQARELAKLIGRWT